VPQPDEAQRRSVLDEVLQTVDEKFMGPDTDTARLRQEHEEAILRSETPEQFEAEMNGLLRALGTSHTGFFHESRPRAAGRIAIAATFMKAETGDGLRWVFLDVHPGGAAALAGIRPGDILLTVNDKEVVPPDDMPFQLGQSYTFTIRRSNGVTERPTLTIPGSKEKQRPIVVPGQVVTSSKLDGGIGLIRVSMFPWDSRHGRRQGHEPRRRRAGV